MKFKFRLETLLHFRQRELEEATIRYREAQGHVDDALGAIDTMYAATDSARGLISNQLQSGSGLAEVAVADSHIEHLKIRIAAKRAEVRELMVVAEEMHDQMAEAARSVKVLETLKEKQLQEFKTTQKKKEAKELDDLTSMRFGRRR